MVMEGDSCSEGHGFESQHRILDGHFFTYICCKNCNYVFLKRPKINDKRGRGWPIFLKNVTMSGVCSSVGRAVTSITSGPRFESSHLQNVIEEIDYC